MNLSFLLSTQCFYTMCRCRQRSVPESEAIKPASTATGGGGSSSGLGRFTGVFRGFLAGGSAGGTEAAGSLVGFSGCSDLDFRGARFLAGASVEDSIALLFYLSKRRAQLQ